MQSLKMTRRQRGFTLLEALIALLITSFGLMTLAGMQMMLSRNADVAKQRGEATRLAQERIEGMRSFTAIETVQGSAAWADLANGQDDATTNTVYTRTVTMQGTSDDPLRFARVNVAWKDRANADESVVMRTVISRTDPSDIGALGFPLPQNTTLKRPKNRHVNIPVRATDLGGGKSVFQVNANFAVVFNNDSGYIVQKCNATVTTAAQLAGCAVYNGYILAGYVSKTMNAFPAVLSVSTTGITGSDTSRTIDCVLADAVDQNTGNAIAGYKYYLCIVPVVSGQSWSGTMRLAGMASGSSYRVCRMQYPAASGVSANERNVQPYSQVAQSLDNQNYIITTGNSCPTVSTLATTLHQGCASNNGPVPCD